MGKRVEKMAGGKGGIAFATAKRSGIMLVLAALVSCAAPAKTATQPTPSGVMAEQTPSRAEQNKAIAQKLLTALGQREDPEKIAEMFSEDVAFDIPGDSGVLPWIGRNRGRAAVVTFVSSMRRLTTPMKFKVQDVLASETRAVILLDLVTKLNTTGNTIETEAAVVLEIQDGLIHRYLMAEDSFDVSKKARR